MNKIYLSGIVADPPVQFSEEGTPCHISFPLCVSHKNKQGIVKRELYTIQAWNGVAEWAQANLRQGQRTMMQGYLTQRIISSAEEHGRIIVEVTAEEFFAASGSLKNNRLIKEAQREDALC